MKLRVATAGGGEIVTPAGRPGLSARARTLLLGLAIAAFVLLSLMVLSSGAVVVDLPIPPELVSEARREPVAGLSWLQIVGASSGAAATWLLVRRARLSARRK